MVISIFLSLFSFYVNAEEIQCGPFLNSDSSVSTTLQSYLKDFSEDDLGVVFEFEIQQQTSIDLNLIKDPEIRTHIQKLKDEKPEVVSQVGEANLIVRLTLNKFETRNIRPILNHFNVTPLEEKEYWLIDAKALRALSEISFLLKSISVNDELSADYYNNPVI